VANLFTLLPLLQKLFPNPLEPLLPAASLKNKGEMSLAQRKQHTEKAGTEWFSTGELDLMLSILASDVQEDSFSSSLPCDLGAPVNRRRQYSKDIQHKRYRAKST
jgi:hypothetical protein